MSSEGSESMAGRNEHDQQQKFSFERYLNVRAARGASFSPDGRTISFLTDITGVPEVWTLPVTPHAATPAWPAQLTFRSDRAMGATYSPTADQILVGGDRGGDERAQLYLLSADGVHFTPLTDQPDVIHQFAGWSEDGTGAAGWSPDGRTITYASNARDQRYFDVYEREIGGAQGGRSQNAPTNGSARDSGQSQNAPTNNGAGAPAGGHAPTNNGARLLYQQDGTNYSAGYSPDGRYVLVERRESNIRDALLLVEVATGAARSLTPEGGTGPGRHVAACWSADGKGLYLLSDRWRDVLMLAWLDLASGEMTYLRDDQWGAEGLALSPDGAHLALVLDEDGYSRLELFDVANGWEQRRELPLPSIERGVLSGLAWSNDGRRLAFTLDVADDAPDVWTWDVAERVLWRATRSSLGGLPRESLVQPSLVHYPTFDGREIPAFLYLPHGVEAKNLPVVVHVHGGPEGQARPIFNPVIQYFANQGYAVLAPNVRGSSGYGCAYQSLDDVRKRMDSVADLKTAAEWLAKSGIADPKRIAVMGQSYGGFMTLAALVTYPELWAAGAELVGIANFRTFLEHTGPWRRKLREAEYGSLENDAEFLESISPLTKVDRIVAPLIVIHGANDPRVPVGETEQIVAALKQRGIPVEYLRFPDEGHGLQKRHNKLVAYPAIARFLYKYVKDRA